MQKIDEVVLKETKYISLLVLTLSLLMQIIFVVFGEWNIAVLSGNILSAVTAILNFLWMGITVQKAVVKEEKDARSLMRTSQALRTLFLFIILALGISLKCFDSIAVVVPLFFPRIAITLKLLFKKGDDSIS